MRASRKRTLGVTLIEVMTAIACLALVSASLVGGLSFASERLKMAEERGLVANRLRQVMEDLKADPNREPNYSQTSSASETLAGVSGPVTITSAITGVSGKPGLQELSCQASWTAVIGELARQQTMTLHTYVLRDPPIPKIGAALAVKGTNSFLHLNDPANPSPIILDLLAYGFTEGSTLDIWTSGSYTSGPGTTSSTIAAVFSRSSLVLGKDQAVLSRTPDAVEAGTDINTGSTGAGVNIPQDFAIGPSVTRIDVPKGARYLLFGVYDSLSDNAGSLIVEVAPV